MGGGQRAAVRPVCGKEDEGASRCGCSGCAARRDGQAAGAVLATLIGCQQGAVSRPGGEQHAIDTAARRTDQHRIGLASGLLAAEAGKRGRPELPRARPVAQNAFADIRIAQGAIEEIMHVRRGL